eukprot:tig00020875_g14895.t1
MFSSIFDLQDAPRPGTQSRPAPSKDAFDFGAAKTPEPEASEPREPCAYGCGRSLPSRLLPCHVSTECPLAPVPCCRAHRGCGYVCEREVLPDHIRACPYRKRRSPAAGGSPASAGSASPGSDYSPRPPQRGDYFGFASFSLPPPALPLEGRVPTYSSAPGFLSLRITDPVGTLEFRMKRNAEFHKMMVKYGRQRGLSPSDMMFSTALRGTGTPLREFHTPASLGLCDGDEIIAVPMALAMAGEDALRSRSLLALSASQREWVDRTPPPSGGYPGPSAPSPVPRPSDPVRV